MTEFQIPPLLEANEAFRLLYVVENRYRKDRLRLGSKALMLPVDEEERVLLAEEAACDIYAGAGVDARAAIRGFFSSSYSLRPRLIKVAGRYSARFSASAAPDELRKALVALSVEDAQTDARDTITILQRLRDRVTDMVDVQAIFVEVAEISSDRMRRLLNHRTGPVDLGNPAVS